VNYQRGGQILINQDLYEKMNLINQTALVAHEAFYAFLRDRSQETNSIRTRRAIGYVISNHVFAAESVDVPKPNIICYDEGIPYSPTVIYLWPMKDKNGKANGAKFYPRLSNGTMFLGSTAVSKFPMISEAQLAQLSTGKCNSGDNMFFKIVHRLNGPVEFDRQISVEFYCKEHSPIAYLENLEPGAGTVKRATLKCELRQ
jgi:hypothetical protein